MQPSEFERRWRRRFNERGTEFDDDAAIAGWTPSGLATRVRQFRRLWEGETRPAGVWLDVGCGAGTYTSLLHTDGHHVLGLDYSTPSLRKAKRRCGEDRTGIDFCSADVLRLPIRTGRIDGVLCFGVIQALSASRPALAELLRVLKPGGELWVDALNARCLPTALSEWRRRRRGGAPHLRYEDPDVFEETARAAGFTIVSRHWLAILPGHWSRYQWLVETPPARGLLSGWPGLGGRVAHSVVLRARKPIPR